MCRDSNLETTPQIIANISYVQTLSDHIPKSVPSGAAAFNTKHLDRIGDIYLVPFMQLHWAANITLEITIVLRTNFTLDILCYPEDRNCSQQKLILISISLKTKSPTKIV